MSSAKRQRAFHGSYFDLSVVSAGECLSPAFVSFNRDSANTAPTIAVQGSVYLSRLPLRGLCSLEVNWLSGLYVINYFCIYPAVIFISCCILIWSFILHRRDDAVASQIEL